MRKLFSIIFLVLLMGIQMAAEPSATSGYRLFVLKKASGDAVIEIVPLNEGAVKVFPISKASNNIALIFPYGLGQSGDLIKLSENRLLIAQYIQGDRHRYESASGKHH